MGAATALKPSQPASANLTPNQPSPASSVLGGQLSTPDAMKVTDKRIGDIEDSTDALKPPKMDDLPPMPQPQNTSPLQIWGSAAMAMAAIGSLLTRQPLTTALNSAAAVMKSYKQGDIETANAEFARWKVSTDNAIKIHNFQMEMYKSALQKASTDERTALAELRAYAASNHDTVMEGLAREGKLIEAQRLVVDRENFGLRLQEAQPKIIEDMAFHNATTELVKTPEFKNADAIGRLHMVTRLAGELTTYQQGDGSPKDKALAQAVYKTQFPGDPTTGARPGAPDFEQWYGNEWPSWGSERGMASEDPDETSNPYSVAISEVDKALNMATPDVVGTRGLVGRVTQGIEGQFDPTTKAPARQFANQVAIVQTQVRNLVSKSKYMSKEAQDQINEIVRGMSPLDTIDDTKASLEKLKAILEQKRGSAPGVASPTGDASSMSDAELKKALGL